MKLDFRKSYNEHKDRLLKRYPKDRAMELAVGGDFKATGIIQRELLILLGLTPESSLVDVGCGTGRLAAALREYLRGPYLGTDVVPDFLAYARQVAQRPDFQFETVRELSIPAASGEADMVCFFSVFTHLLHEQSYVYLRDAARVLKPGGTVVFSFLEFAMLSHWTVFEASISQAGEAGESGPLNVFLGRDAITAWADHLALRVERIIDGHEHVIPLPHPVQMDDGRVIEKLASFGQSVCVMSKA